MDDIKEIKSDIKDIKDCQIETNIKLAQYNTLLDVHIQGVKDLQARVEPIEDHVKFIRKLMNFTIKGISVLAATATLLKLFLR